MVADAGSRRRRRRHRCRHREATAATAAHTLFCYGNFSFYFH